MSDIISYTGPVEILDKDIAERIDRANAELEKTLAKIEAKVRIAEVKVFAAVQNLQCVKNQSGSPSKIKSVEKDAREATMNLENARKEAEISANFARAVTEEKISILRMEQAGRGSGEDRSAVVLSTEQKMAKANGELTATLAKIKLNVQAAEAAVNQASERLADTHKDKSADFLDVWRAANEAGEAAVNFEETKREAEIAARFALAVTAEKMGILRDEEKGREGVLEEIPPQAISQIPQGPALAASSTTRAVESSFKK